MKCYGLFFKRVFLTLFALTFLINTVWAKDGVTVLKFATLGQKGISIMIYLEDVFMPEVKNVTDGNEVFDVYWEGVMG